MLNATSRRRRDLILEAHEAANASDLRQAEALARAAQALPPGDDPVVASEHEVLLGTAFQKVGCRDDASAAFGRAVSISLAAGDNLRADFMRYAQAEYFLAECRYEAAIETLALIAPTSTNYPHARALIAVALSRLGRPDEARAEAMAALQAADEDQRSHVEGLLEPIS